jgi:hypothetical protein
MQQLPQHLAGGGRALLGGELDIQLPVRERGANPVRHMDRKGRRADAWRACEDDPRQRRGDVGVQHAGQRPGLSRTTDEVGQVGGQLLRN